MRMFYTLLVFGISLQLAAYLIQVFQIIPNGSIPLGISPEAIAATFSITVIATMFTGDAIITIVGLLLRQQTYAIYGLVVWTVGVLLPIVRDFFLAIPNFISAAPIPSELATPLLLVVTAIYTFAAFMFFIELTTQRNIS